MQIYAQMILAVKTVRVQGAQQASIEGCCSSTQAAQHLSNFQCLPQGFVDFLPHGFVLQ